MYVMSRGVVVGYVEGWVHFMNIHRSALLLCHPLQSPTQPPPLPTYLVNPQLHQVLHRPHAEAQRQEVIVPRGLERRQVAVDVVLGLQGVLEEEGVEGPPLQPYLQGGAPVWCGVTWRATGWMMVWGGEEGGYTSECVEWVWPDPTGLRR